LILLAGCLLGFIVIEMGFGSWLRSPSTDRNRRLELVGLIQSCLSSLIDSESACHSYLLTHDRHFLEPFDQSVKTLATNIDDTKPLCKYANENAFIGDLKVKAAAKVKVCEEMGRIEDAKAWNPQLMLQKMHAAHEAMDAYRDDTQKFLALEDSTIRPETKLVDAGRNWLNAFRIFVFIASLFVVARMFRLQKQQEHYLAAALASRDEALAATRMKSEFASTMSHEIRTPLSAIVGFSEMMIDEPNAETADIIHTQSRKLLQIVNEILDFSKLEAGMSTFNRSRVSLAELFENIIRATSTAAQKNETTVSYIVEGDDTISGDEVKLSQILLNFISNAIKFSNKGTVVITATHTGPDTSLRIEVKDSGIGIGIDVADLNKLFIPFSQVDNSNTRKYGGTGLGLSICKKLVELMGGTIHCTSTNGQGSSFWIELPSA
jgi:signal transduction histidine kinase